MIKVTKSDKLNNVLIFEQEQFQDFRGTYTMSYSPDYPKLIKEHLGVDIDFVEDDFAVKRKNALTGVHGNEDTWKLISCVFGEFYLVVVDPKTKKWEGFILSRENKKQVLVPAGYGNGFLVLSDWAAFHYKQSTDYRKFPNTFTLKWNDPTIGIYWPIKDPLLSKRDAWGLQPGE